MHEPEILNSSLAFFISGSRVPLRFHGKAGTELMNVIYFSRNGINP